MDLNNPKEWQGNPRSIPPRGTNEPRDLQPGSLNVPPDHPAVHLVRDAVGRLVHLDHLEVFDLARDDGKPHVLADAYVQANQSLFGIEEILDLGPRPGKFSRADGTKLRQGESKLDGPALVYGYAQYLNNVPVWGGGLSVLMIPLWDGAHRVVGMSSDVHFDVTHPIPGADPVLMPKLTDDGADPDGVFIPGRIQVDHLYRLLSLDPAYATLKITKILEPSTLYYYRYDALRRFVPPPWEQGFSPVRRKPKASSGGQTTEGTSPDSPRSTEDDLTQDLHYLATELHFLAVDGAVEEGAVELEYQAFVSVGTGRLLVVHTQAAACLAAAFPQPTAPPVAHGRVLNVDPWTRKGTAGGLPAGPITAAALDGLAEDGLLDGISTAAGTALSNTDVQLSDNDNSGNTFPVQAPGGQFNDVPSTNPQAFSAVTVYYHVASLFRMIKQLHVDSKYTQGELPMWVDDLSGPAWYGYTAGYTRGVQHDEFFFGPLQTGSNFSAGLDVRLVLHEFGHLLTFRSCGALNLGFAHSAGDSLAAILTDPCSKLWHDPDHNLHDPERDERFSTFPWYKREFPLNTAKHRFHGGTTRRPTSDPANPQASWAWWSARAKSEELSATEAAGYDREQMLSTTLFRAYRAIGGDSEDFEQRLHAARYMAYLILEGIALLPRVYQEAGQYPEDLAAKMRAADGAARYVAGPNQINPLFGDLPGGAVRKVIKWAFEEQGLYLPPAPATPCSGRGPNGTGPDSGKGQLSDLYIGASRAGYLPYCEGIFDTTDDLWLQIPGTAANPAAALAAPLVNQPNSIFVRVRNRGVAAASQVKVKVHWRADRRSSQWDPGSLGGWIEIPAPAGLPTSIAGTAPACTPGVQTFGPFQWTPPSSPNGWVLLARVSSSEDASTLDTDFPCAHFAIPLARVLPYDNNLALRRYPSP